MDATSKSGCAAFAHAAGVGSGPGLRGAAGGTAVTSHARSVRAAAVARRGRAVVKMAAKGGKALGPDGRLSDAELKAIVDSELNKGMPTVGGFTEFSELLNGRAAMVGFAAVLVIEFVSGRGLIPIVNELLAR